MKNSEEIMETLEAYDLTGSFRTAVDLAGCGHETVGRRCGVTRCRPVVG